MRRGWFFSRDKKACPGKEAFWVRVGCTLKLKIEVIDETLLPKLRTIPMIVYWCAKFPHGIIGMYPCQVNWCLIIVCKFLMGLSHCREKGKNLEYPPLEEIVEVNQYGQPQPHVVFVTCYLLLESSVWHLICLYCFWLKDYRLP